MAITKVTSGLISADASSIDLNIDAGTLYLDVSENKVGIGTTSPTGKLGIYGGGINDIPLVITHAWGSSSTALISASNASSEVFKVERSGLVGIGTSPATELHVKASSGDCELRLEAVSGSDARLRFGDATDNDAGYIGYSRSSGFINFSALNTAGEHMRIDSSGSIGLNTTSLSTEASLFIGKHATSSNAEGGQLVLQSSINGSKAIHIDNYNNASVDYCRFMRGTDTGSEAILGVWDITNTRFGIGTSSPTQMLTLSNGTFQINGSSSFSSNVEIGRVGGDNNMGFATGGSERMRIDSSGRLLLGHASAVGGHSELLGIDADQASGYGIFVSGDSSTGGSTNINAMRFYDSGSSAGIVGSIIFNDTLTAYNTSSDYRLKENVDYEFNALDRVAQLKPARFNFINNKDKTVDGFIAHEVQNIVPEAVTGEKDAVDDEGNPEYQGIDQSKLVPLLTKAIQEQQTIIDNLKTRIETLENA